MRQGRKKDILKKRGWQASQLASIFRTCFNQPKIESARKAFDSYHTVLDVSTRGIHNECVR
jgi:hypothetical protein